LLRFVDIRPDSCVMDDELSPTDGTRDRRAVGREEPGPTQFPSAASLGIMEAGTIRKEIVHIPPPKAVGTREAGGEVEFVTLELSNHTD